MRAHRAGFRSSHGCARFPHGKWGEGGTAWLPSSLPIRMLPEAVRILVGGRALGQTDPSRIPALPHTCSVISGKFLGLSASVSSSAQWADPSSTRSREGRQGCCEDSVPVTAPSTQHVASEFQPVSFLELLLLLLSLPARSFSLYEMNFNSRFLYGSLCSARAS